VSVSVVRTLAWYLPFFQLIIFRIFQHDRGKAVLNTPLLMYTVAVAVILSVRPSICPSVCSSVCLFNCHTREQRTTLKRLNVSSNRFDLRHIIPDLSCIKCIGRIPRKSSAPIASLTNVRRYVSENVQE